MLRGLKDEQEFQVGKRIGLGGGRNLPISPKGQSLKCFQYPAKNVGLFKSGVCQFHSTTYYIW